MRVKSRHPLKNKNQLLYIKVCHKQTIPKIPLNLISSPLLVVARAQEPQQAAD